LVEVEETVSAAHGRFPNPAHVPHADSAPTRSPAFGGDTDDLIRESNSYMPSAPPGYELIRRLGAGGMGTVYLAHERAAERMVAIKFLNAPSSSSAFERFLVEARALARLNHPNIIKVITVETNWREPFLTMEYANEGTVADLAEKRPAPADAARIMLAATEAVGAAHAAGILHRDIKPSNILLQSPQSPVASLHSNGEGLGTGDWGPNTPKVSDFGLAKRTDRDDGLTLTAQPLGTPRYMSPEAAAGRYGEIGPPADVYGLGATLYNVLTGEHPFHGDTPEQIIERVIRDSPVRPRALRPDVPAQLEAIIVKAMAKSPADRYPTADALAADLRRFLIGEAPTAPLLSPWRRAKQWFAGNRRRFMVGVSAILIAIALMVIGFLFGRPTAGPEEQIRSEIAAGKKVRLLGIDGKPRVAEWPLGPAELVTSTDAGGTCTFESRETRVLLLLNDPEVDSYRFEAEILQAEKLARKLPGTGSPIMNDVGLVLAYAGQDGPDGTRVHSMMFLGFVEPDAEDAPGEKRELALMDVGWITGGPAFVGPRDLFTVRGVRPVPLTRSRSGEPEWRHVVAEMTPAGMRVPGPKGLQMTEATAIGERRRLLNSRIAAAQTVPMASLQDWSPRMALGVWCRGSKISVRNVIIEPLK
jgi:serine/threonine protein kinase